MCDQDVFGDDEDNSPEREKEKELDLAGKEFLKMNSQIEKSGFRDGFLQGKESSLQRGFDAGFEQSFHNFSAISHIKGVLLALLTMKETTEQDSQPGSVDSDEPKEETQPESTEGAEAEEEVDEVTTELRSIFEGLEDLEMVMCDVERMGVMGVSNVHSTFNHLKQRLISVLVNEGHDGEGKIVNQLASCDLKMDQILMDRINSTTLNDPNQSDDNHQEEEDIDRYNNELNTKKNLHHHESKEQDVSRTFEEKLSF